MQQKLDGKPSMECISSMWNMFWGAREFMLQHPETYDDEVLTNLMSIIASAEERYVTDDKDERR